MVRRRPAAALALVLLLALPVACSEQPVSSPLATPAEETGTLDGAPYRIDVPADWNGELVVLAHGFEPVGAPRTTPWPANDATPVFLSSGYAVAQSGYATQGWAVADGIVDSERLRRHFVAHRGAPRRTWLVGFSMGGAVAVASLERHPSHYDGALSLCGANVPGAMLAGELFTTLVAFDALFPDAAGLPAGGLSGPAAAALGQRDVMNAVAAALPRNPDAAAVLAARLEVPVDAVPGIAGLHALIFHDVQRRAGGPPVDNRGTRYTGFGDDDAFNATVPRHAGDATAITRAASAPGLSGRVEKPLVLQYNAGDPTIAPRFQPVYARLAQQAGDGLQPVTLPAVGEGHCDFSGEQIAHALSVLTRWATTGRRPVGD